MSYLSTSDMTLFLLEEGLIPADDYYTPNRKTTLLNNAITRWEDLTGYSPFLAVTATRYFDPPDSNQLEIEGGILSVASLTIAGNTYTENTHFYLMPTNALNVGIAFSYIEFVFEISGLPRTIVITGEFGAVSSIPNAVNEAIKRLVAIEVIDSFTPKGGSIIELAQDDLRIRYAGYTPSAQNLTKRELYNQFVQEKLGKGGYGRTLVIV